MQPPKIRTDLFVREQGGDAPLNAALAVFQVDIEHVALLAFDGAHRLPAHRYSDGEVEREPCLSQLLAAGENREAFRQIVGHRPSQWFECGLHDGVGARRDEAVSLPRMPTSPALGIIFRCGFCHLLDELGLYHHGASVFGRQPAASASLTSLLIPVRDGGERW